MNGLPNSKEHRTALVIDIRSGVTADFRNRYQRLLESLNGNNIKVDVHTLRGNAANTGPGLVVGGPDAYVAPDQPAQEIDLLAWAADLGYTMLLVATSTGI